MVGSSNTVKMGLDSGFQLILVVSVLMHILAIAFVTDPFGSKDKIDDSYFVKLVMSAKRNQPPKAALIEKALKKEKTLVNVKPEKKQQPEKKQVKAKSSEVTVKPIEKKSIKKSYVDKMQSSKSILPLSKSRSTSVKKHSIKRNVQGNKKQYSSDAIKMDRTGRGSGFKSKTDIAKQGKVIAGKGVSGKTEYKSVAKGLREQSYSSVADQNNEQHMIERNNILLEKDNVPVEKAFRDSMFAAAGERKGIDERQYEISRAEDSIKNKTTSDYTEDDTVEYPETDFSRNPGMASITENQGMPAILRPAGQTRPAMEKVSYNTKKEQLINDAELDEEITDGNKSSSEMSIKGVPLDDLNACSNALDERMLKKKILNIVGNEKECYSKDVGEYLFMGTVRFASFDMNILPRAGRKLSNRCEELRNAFHCLTQR